MTESKNWHVAVAGTEKGTYTKDEVLAQVAAGTLGSDAHVFTQGMNAWVQIDRHPDFAASFGGQAAPPLPPAAAVGGGSHEIDYEVFGEEMQYVEITLDPQEACVAEAGAFMYMDPGIEMQTIFGDGSAGSEGSTFMGKVLGAGKRWITGESIFMTLFGNGGAGREKVAFASPYPGRIIPLDLAKHGTILCQKDAFLCAAKGTAVGVAFNKKLGAGFFGGEGFILQKLEGDGLAFVHAGGTIMERELKPGEKLRIDTGCLVAFDNSVQYDIQMVSGVKTALFGGEGLFFAALTGPGTVWIQSLPFSRLASRVFAAAPQTGRGRAAKGEGSILGGLGDLVMGD